MPRLWMKHYRETILHRSIEAAVRVQQHAVRRWRVPWGISESACVSEQGTNDYGYHAFGIPELAMKASEESD